MSPPVGQAIWLTYETVDPTCECRRRFRRAGVVKRVSGEVYVFALRDGGSVLIGADRILAWNPGDA